MVAGRAAIISLHVQTAKLLLLMSLQVRSLQVPKGAASKAASQKPALDAKELKFFEKKMREHILEQDAMLRNEQSHANSECPCIEEHRRFDQIRETGRVWHQTCKACKGKVCWLSVLTYLQDSCRAAQRSLSTLSCICSARSTSSLRRGAFVGGRLYGWGMLFEWADDVPDYD